MKKTFLLFLGIALLLFTGLQAIETEDYSQLEPEVFLGESKVLMKFDAGFAVDGDNTFYGIKVYNPSSVVPFSSKAINRIVVYRDDGTIPGAKDDFDSQVGSVVVASETAFDTQTIDFIAAVNLTVTESFYIEYYVSSQANFSDPGNSNVDTQVALKEIRDSSGWKEPTVTQPGAYSIVVKASGLVYRNSSIQSIVPSSNNFGAGYQAIPVMAFEFLAMEQDITVNMIEISGYSYNFGTSSTNRRERVERVRIFQDLGGKEFSGVDSELLVADAVLPTNNNDHDRVRLNIDPVKIAQYDEGLNNGTYFFVVFDVGSSIPLGKLVNCRLSDASGTGASGLDVDLLGSLPVGNAEFEIASVNLTLKSATAETFGYPAVAGQKNIKMVEFTVEAMESIENATLVIYNSDASFSSAGAGVSKVSLYKWEGGTWYVVGSTTQFETRSIAKIKGIDISQSPEIRYYVAYDLETSTLYPWSNDYISCQIQTFEGDEVVFGGVPTERGAPGIPARVDYRPSRLWVEYVSVNATQAEVGDWFQVEIGVRNIWGVVDLGNEKGSIWTLPDECQPMFYFETKDGINISSEFEIVPVQASENIETNFSNIAVFTYDVRPTVNLAHDGYVVVDARLVYEDDPSRHGADPQDVHYLRHYESGVIVPAARKWSSKADSYATLRVIYDEDQQEGTNPFPSYITSINITNQSEAERKVFIDGDMIPENSRMEIYLFNKGADLDTPLTVELNGNVLSPASEAYNWDPVKGYIELKNLGTGSGTIKLSGTSGGSAAIETAYISFRIADSFVVEDFYAYPSPLNTADGDECTIGFFSSEDGSATIYIYDSTLQLIHKSEKIQVQQGYNTYDQWDVDNEAGAKVGSGAYMIYMQIKGNNSSKEKVIKTKLGIR